MRNTSLDVSLFSIGGTSLLADLTDVRVIGDIDLVDGATVKQFGQSPTPVRRSVKLETDLVSTSVSAPVRVTGLNIGQLLLNTIEHKGIVTGLKFRGVHSSQEGAGLADIWKYPVITRKAYIADLELLVDSTGPYSLLLAGLGGGSVSATLELDLNGVDIALPMVMESVSHEIMSERLQVWSLRLVGQAPVSGDYPTFPNTVSSLLGSAFVEPGVALSSVLASRLTGGQSYSGSFVIKDFGFVINRESVVKSRYRLASFGAVTAVTT